MILFDSPHSSYRLIIKKLPPISNMDNLCQSLENTIIGHFYDKTNRKRIAKIHLSQCELQRAKQSLACTTLPTHGEPYILIGYTVFKLLLKRIPASLFFLFHELGHIVLNHVESYNPEERKKLPLGIVSPFEQEADAFAMQIVGHAVAVDTLQKLWTLRNLRSEPPEIHQKALKEIKARIQLLNNLAKNTPKTI